MASAYLISLCAGGRTVATLRMRSGCAEVTVGRSSSCSLCTPSEDRSVSGTHVRLYWKGKSLYIEDAGSRNGTYYGGSLLEGPHKIVPGDMFAIGSNTLRCELPEKNVRKSSSEQHHRLERLNGDDAGHRIDIVPRPGEGAFTIGRDNSNTLVLRDGLVSEHHAELTVRENGECWLRDLGSSNGTYVNGEPLRDRDRLLKDNDRISIAYFDFQFLDRSKKHDRFFLWLKMFVAAATLSVMAGAYVVWIVMTPGAESCLREAQRYAASCEFKAARDAILEARKTRDADNFRAQIDVFEAQVERWEKTYREWADVQSLLENGRFMSARKIVDPLVTGLHDAWLWNGTTAIEEKRKAEFASIALRQYYDAREVLDAVGDGQPEERADAIKAKVEPLAKFMASSTEQFAAQPYLNTLSNDIVQAQMEMNSIQRGFERVDKCISKLDAVNPDFARLANELDEVICDQTLNGAVRAYADKYKKPCAELAEAKMFIRREFEDLNAMHFLAIKNRADALKLPSKDICSRHQQLSHHRLKLEGHHADAQTYAVNLHTMVEGLAERGVTSGDCGSHLKRVLDIDSWNKALTFGCFDEKPPTTRRKDPSGFYDELLGVDFTFQSLRTLPDSYNGWCLRMIGFSPDVVEARKTLDYIEVLVNYLAARPAWLRRGDLGAFDTYCNDLLEKRKNLIEFLAGYRGQERAQIVTTFYAGWFSGNVGLQERRALAERFRKLQREVSELCERYSTTSDPIEQITLRSKILAVGLPGDSQLHPKWVQKFEGGIR